MSTVEEIKEAIAKLSQREYCELLAGLHPFEDDEWDQDMKADAAKGKFASLNARADADSEAGRCEPIDGMFEQKRA